MKLSPLVLLLAVTNSAWSQRDGVFRYEFSNSKLNSVFPLNCSPLNMSLPSVEGYIVVQNGSSGKGAATLNVRDQESVIPTQPISRLIPKGADLDKVQLLFELEDGEFEVSHRFERDTTIGVREGGCRATFGVDRSLERYGVGDANYDGSFDSSDFVTVFGAGVFETGDFAQWDDGDWNGDWKFDTADLVWAFSKGSYQGQTAAAMVPESGPHGTFAALGCIALLGAIRRKRRFDRSSK